MSNVKLIFKNYALNIIINGVVFEFEEYAPTG